MQKIKQSEIAREFCADRKLEFKIMTEKELEYNILQNITNKIGNRSRSGEWFRTQLMEELDNNPDLNFNDMDTGGFSPGNLYQYTYNATTEQPYYDMYPLTYVIEMQPGGFLGCNLHCKTQEKRRTRNKSSK